MSQMKIHSSIGTRSKTWLRWTNIVKSIQNLNWVEEYTRIHRKRLISRKKIYFPKCCKILDTLCKNYVSVTKLCAKPLNDEFFSHLILVFIVFVENSS